MWNKKYIFALFLLLLAITLSLFASITRDNLAAKIIPFILFLYTLVVLISIFKQLFSKSKKEK